MVMRLGTMCRSRSAGGRGARARLVYGQLRDSPSVMGPQLEAMLGSSVDCECSGCKAGAREATQIVYHRADVARRAQLANIAWFRGPSCGSDRISARLASRCCGRTRLTLANHRAHLLRLAIVSAQAPRPWRRRLLDQGPATPPPPEPARGNSLPRDPRLPAAGTILRREYRHSVHEVLVLHDDFEYRGKRYASLSLIAREITGTTWNGFGFFRIPSSTQQVLEAAE